MRNDTSYSITANECMAHPVLGRVRPYQLTISIKSVLVLFYFLGVRFCTHVSESAVALSI